MKLKDLHPAALKEIERAMKNDLKKRAGSTRLEERTFTHEEYHKKEETQKKHPGGPAGDRDRDDRSRAPGWTLDRIGDPDQRETQRDGRGG